MKAMLIIGSVLLLAAAVVVLAGGEQSGIDEPVRNLLKSTGQYSDEQIDSILDLPLFPQIDATTGKFVNGTQRYVAPGARAVILITFNTQPDEDMGFYRSEVCYDYTRKEK